MMIQMKYISGVIYHFLVRLVVVSGDRDYSGHMSAGNSG